MVVNVFSIPHVIKVTLDNFNSGVNMIENSFYSNPLIRLIRGTDQHIDILIKDYDRKSVLLEDYQIVHFRLFDIQQREILNIPATTVDFERGHYSVDLTAAQTSALLLRTRYTWCCTVEDSEAETTQMVHSNRDYGTHSPVEVIEGPTPIRQETQTISIDSLSQGRSSSLMGSVQVANYSGTHSMVFPLEAFTGTISIQASTDDSMPNTDEEWVNVKLADLEEETSNYHMGFTGNYTWVRFVLTSTVGVSDVTYRNL